MGVGVNVGVFVLVAVKVWVGVFVRVGVDVSVGVEVGVDVGVAVRNWVAVLICLGVPLIELLFASVPLRVTPSFDDQFESLSAVSGFLRSIE